MVLYVTDTPAATRAMRRHLHLDKIGDQYRSDDAELRVLPKGRTAAAAAMGAAMAESSPEIITVITAVTGDASAEIGIIYRCTLGEEIWIPDVLFEHSARVLSVTGGSTENIGSETVITPAAAAALGAAVTVVGPMGCVGVVAGDAAFAEPGGGSLAAAIEQVTAAAQSVLRESYRKRENDHVTDTVRLSTYVAEQLRLTATQRHRFLQLARSAAVRSGAVPEPLDNYIHRHKEDPQSMNKNTKAEKKRILNALETNLEQLDRATI